MVLGWMIGPALAGGTIDVESMSVDGLELRALHCELDKAPMLGSLVIAGALAAQKDALHACAPEGHAFKVAWTWSDTTTASVTTSSRPDKDACIVEAIGKVPAALPGTCTAVLLTGPTEAAEKAREGL